MFCIKLLISMKTSKQIPTRNQCISDFNMYIGTRPTLFFSAKLTFFYSM